MAFESQLLPILREANNIIKMILFKKLKTYLSNKYSKHEASYINKLSGAIINDLFGTPSSEENFASFAAENKALIDKEIENIATEFPEMRIPLTDALRIQFLCDSQEGIDSSSILSRAKDLSLLLMDREVPLPKNFINLVRHIGNKFDLLAPQDVMHGNA